MFDAVAISWRFEPLREFGNGVNIDPVAQEIATDRKGRKSVIFLNGTAQFRTIASALVVESHLDAMTTARAVCPSSITKEGREKFDRKAFLA